jgi:type VI secretion system secreted protein Hcp
MAVDMFLKIDGVDGESKDKVHSKQIDVLAWSWGLTNSGSAHVGGGAGSGKVNVQDISITKWIDSASPKLVVACCEGSHYSQVLLTVRKAAGKAPLEYVKITLNEVLIAGISTGGSGGEDRLTENVTLNFGKFSMDYTPQQDDGSAGTAINAAWDVAGNAAD